MPASNINPTYLTTEWCLVADWSIQYKAKKSGKSKRVSWKTNLGQVMTARSSTSYKETKRSPKEVIILFTTSTMDDEDPELAFRISNLVIDRLPSELRTALHNKTLAQIASTSLLTQRLHEMTLLFV